MMIWAPLTKSPNCASQATRASGASTEYPYSKPTAAYSESSESRTVKLPISPGGTRFPAPMRRSPSRMWASGTYSSPLA